MNQQPFKLPVIVLFVCGFALGLAGIVFLSDATGGSSSSSEILRNRMAAGITCLSLATVFVLFGAVMAFLGAHISRPKLPPSE